MTWTYDATSITTDLAKVRLFLGDTDTNDQLLTDEEINYALDEEGGVRAAAALAATWLASEFARQCTKAVGSLSIQLSDKAKQFRELAKELRSHSVTYALPYAGGISVTNKTAQEDDTDRVDPAFYRGMLDNPGGSTSSTDDELA